MGGGGAGGAVGVVGGVAVKVAVGASGGGGGGAGALLMPSFSRIVLKKLTAASLRCLMTRAA